MVEVGKQHRLDFVPYRAWYRKATYQDTFLRPNDVFTVEDMVTEKDGEITANGSPSGRNTDSL